MAIETLGAALRQISHLFGDGTVTGLPDAQLLDRFLAEGDAACFEALLARHGPMVLSVCRGVLRDFNDAEDAFQATFLILVKKARTIRGRQALGGWLYQVAHRVAIQANLAAARRRSHEREAGQMIAASATSGPHVPDGLLPALHQEIARLPEKYRLPVVLCDLEGLPQAEVAGQLNWSERTLRRRLAEARDRLKVRLARRDLAPDGAALGAVFLREARAAVPPAWNAAAVRAALRTIHPAVTAGTVSAAAQSLTHEVLETMFVQKLTIALAALIGAGLMAWATSAALVSRGDEPPAVPAAVVQRAAPRPEAESGALDTVGTFPVRGRVLDPDGRPVAGAEIYVCHDIDLQLDQTRTPSRRRSLRAAVSDAEGNFRFELDKAASDDPFGQDPAWHNAQIAAVANGFGPAWVTVESLLTGREAMMRLVRDDVPIRGRVLNSEGRPAAGVTVRVTRIAWAGDGADLDAMLTSGQVDTDVFGNHWYHYPTWLGREGTWTTDADGRFVIAGIGRDRVVALEFDGPALEHVSFCAMARPARTPIKPRPQPDRRTTLRFPAPRLAAATFDHVLGPTKPIAGIVRLKDTKKPLSGLRVTGTALPTGPRVSTLTDARGRFRLDGLPKAGSYEVSADPRSGIDPFLGAEITVTDTAGLAPIETALELPRGVIVTGRLIDPATGRTVPTNQLHHHRLPANRNEGRSATGRSGVTDPTFRITVPPGEGILMTYARGLETPYTRAHLREADRAKFPGGVQEFERNYSIYHAYRMVDIPAGVESFTIDLELTRGLARKGKVIDPDGRPVAGARCYGIRPTWGYIKTLTDDTFEVLGLEPGRPRLVVFAHQGRRLVGSVVLTDKDLESDEPLVVRLLPAGSIKGRLVDEDGLPLAGARIGVMTYDLDGDNLPPGANHAGSYCLWPDGEITVTDAMGRFLIDGLKPGVKSSIDIDNPVNPGVRLYLDKLLGGADIKPAEIRDVGDVKITPARGR
jgi:RNA polymerase sigma factor (sigma-70 family)